MVLFNQCPLLVLVGRWLAGHDDVATVVLTILVRAWVFAAVWMVWIFAVERDTGCGRIIKGWWLLRGVVTEAYSHQLTTVGRGDIEIVGLSLGAKGLYLKVDDRVNGVLKRLNSISDG